MTGDSLVEARSAVEWFDRLDRSLVWSGRVMAVCMAAGVAALGGSVGGRIITAVLLVMIVQWGTIALRAAMAAVSQPARRRHEFLVRSELEQWL